MRDYATKAVAEHGKVSATNVQSRAKFDAVNKHLHDIEREHTDFDAHAAELFAALKAGQIDTARKLIGALEIEEEQLNRELEGFVAELEEFTAAAAMHSTTRTSASTLASSRAIFANTLSPSLSPTIKMDSATPRTAMVRSYAF